MALLFGYDVGSSSIKATLMEAETGKVLASATLPDREMEIIAKKTGWAEQHPQTWWENVVSRDAKDKAQTNLTPATSGQSASRIRCTGWSSLIKTQEVLRPAIIWCDSRAVEIGQKAMQKSASKKCLSHLFNLPGNFTASKLKWVKDNEPKVYSKIHKMMLPGDYIAMKMTGEIKTTPSGLSEGIMWDFKEQGLADIVLEHYGISQRSCR